MADVEVSPSYQNGTTNGGVYQNGNTPNTTTQSQQPHQQAPVIEEVDFDGGNSTARLFERTRIQVLADEREHVQKKAYIYDLI